MPEELKNVSIQLDSKTAESIADKYITYKYTDTALGFICVCFCIILVGYVVKLFIKHCD